MDGIDPLSVKAGDVVESAWDEDQGSDSCHCAFRVKVSRMGAEADENLVLVIAHDLQAKDIIREVRLREEEDGCHCDVNFLVSRKP